MSEEGAAHERIRVIWSPEARSDLRAIDRAPAVEILHCIDRYLTSHSGDIKKLKAPLLGYRLRCGEYRIFFDAKDEMTIHVMAVRHRKDAYR